MAITPPRLVISFLFIVLRHCIDTSLRRYCRYFSSFSAYEPEVIDISAFLSSDIGLLNSFISFRWCHWYFLPLSILYCIGCHYGHDYYAFFRHITPADISHTFLFVDIGQTIEYAGQASVSLLIINIVLYFFIGHFTPPPPLLHCFSGHQVFQSLS